MTYEEEKIGTKYRDLEALVERLHGVVSYGRLVNLKKARGSIGRSRQLILAHTRPGRREGLGEVL